MSTKAQPNETAWTSADWQQAVADFKRETDAWSTLQAEEQNIRAVSIWHNAAPEDRESDRMQWCRERIAAAYPNGAPLPRPYRLAGLMEEVHDRIAVATPKWMTAQEAFAVAGSRERSRQAKHLRKRLPPIVKRLAAAICYICAAPHEAFGVVRIQDKSSTSHFPVCESCLVAVSNDDSRIENSVIRKFWSSPDLKISEGGEATTEQIFAMAEKLNAGEPH